MSWRDLPASLQTLAWWLTIVQAVGYSVSLGFVFVTTGMVPSGIAAHYRGADPSAGAGPMEFPKPLGEMLTITHTHLLGLAVAFALSGAALALCERPSERWRRLLIAEPFVAALISFTAMWLMRYVDGRFAWLLGASSAVMAVTFYLQSFLVLRELRRAGQARP